MQPELALECENIGRPPGNTVLVEYGLDHEESDFRVHVCVVTRQVLVCRTASLRELMDERGHELREVSVKTRGIVTSLGRLLPVMWLPDVKTIRLDAETWTLAAFDKADSNSDKGQKAVNLVRWAIRHGLFPFDLNGSRDVIDRDIQLRGIDVLVYSANVAIQVKCDFGGGSRSFGGTGNVYIETHKCNPYNQH